MKHVRTRRGQSSLEIAILFVVVVAAFVAMSLYLQRGAAGGMKSNADSLGTQFSSNAGWGYNSSSTSSTSETGTGVTSNQNSTSAYNQTM